MPVGESRRGDSPTLALWAGAGFLVALALSLATGHHFARQDGLQAMARFGAQTADDLAYLAAESMLRGDRIRLGLLAKRFADRAEVRSVEIYDVEDAALVVEGNPRTQAPAYVRQAAIQNIAAGRVRVTLQADRFHPQTWAVLVRSSGFLAVALLLVVGGAYLYGRSRTPRRRRESGADAPPDARTFVLLASLFPRRAAETASGAVAVSRAVAIGGRIANLYAGDASAWRNSGVTLVFRATASADRAFEVVCAALLLARLLGEADESGADERTPFRLGLDLATEGAAETVAVMASLAPDGALVVGRAAYETIADPERIALRPLDSPAYEALAGTAVPQGIVTGLDADHETLIAEQGMSLRVAARRVGER